jgi:hypothetical protein
MPIIILSVVSSPGNRAGQTGAILIYNRNLDFPEREAAVKYLKTKYSLAP